MSRRRLLAFVGVFEVVAQWALAQTSSVTCALAYDWALNSIHQNPCEVASYLRGVCIPGNFSMGPLSAGTQYPSPTSASASKCDCNTVVYNLVSACADCQSRSFTTWSAWRGSCDVFYNGSFPFPIPPGTFVPRWAFMDVLTSNIYSSESAREAIGFSSSAENQTQTSSPTPNPPPPTAQSDPLAPFLPSPPSKAPNVVGAVIAVLGGVTVFTLVGILVIRQNRRRKIYASSEPQDMGFGKTSVTMSEQNYTNAPYNASRASIVHEMPEEVDGRLARPLPALSRSRVGSMTKSPSSISFHEAGVSRQPSTSARGQAS